MVSSLSNLADKLAEKIQKVNANMDVTMKHLKYVELNIKIVCVALHKQTLKMI